MECKNADWFPALLKSCYSLDTKQRIINELKGSIHKSLRAVLNEGVKYFWTIFLINHLIVYQRCYVISLRYDEMFANMDVVFPTKEDKERIRTIKEKAFSNR